MKMYKLKHQPTGLYYQPHKHRGSNLSKRGKVYQTATHGLSEAMKSKKVTFNVQTEKESVIYRLTKDILEYRECRWAYNQVIAETLLSDWIIEEIK